MHALVDAPLRELYFNGPELVIFALNSGSNLFSVGFWKGLNKEDICAQLTGVSALHWQQAAPNDECASIVERHYNAFRIGVFFFVYIYIVYQFGHLIFARYLPAVMFSSYSSILCQLQQQHRRLQKNH